MVVVVVVVGWLFLVVIGPRDELVIEGRLRFSSPSSSSSSEYHVSRSILLLVQVIGIVHCYDEWMCYDERMC